MSAPNRAGDRRGRSPARGLGGRPSGPRPSAAANGVGDDVSTCASVMARTASLSSASLGKRLSPVARTALRSACVSARSRASNALAARRSRALAARLSPASSCSQRSQPSTALTASMGLSVSAATSGSFLCGLRGFGHRDLHDRPANGSWPRARRDLLTKIATGIDPADSVKRFSEERGIPLYSAERFSLNLKSRSLTASETEHYQAIRSLIEDSFQSGPADDVPAW